MYNLLCEKNIDKRISLVAEISIDIIGIVGGNQRQLKRLGLAPLLADIMHDAFYCLVTPQ